MKTPVQTTQYRNKSGFTLIEIVIVLAIAALILVIVFVAVNGAQRSRRDTARRAAASRVLASITQCASDNAGLVGGTVTCANYITGANGFGTLASATVTLTSPTATTPLPGPYASVGTATCPATYAGASASTPTGGNSCVYYWSEAANGAVLLAGTI